MWPPRKGSMQLNVSTNWLNELEEISGGYEIWLFLVNQKTKIYDIPTLQPHSRGQNRSAICNLNIFCQRRQGAGRWAPAVSPSFSSLIEIDWKIQLGVFIQNQICDHLRKSQPPIHSWSGQSHGPETPWMCKNKKLWCVKIRNFDV